MNVLEGVVKNLLLIIVGLLMAGVVNASKLSSPVKRALARQLSTQLVTSVMGNNIVVQRPTQVEAQQQLISGYLGKLEDTLVSQHAHLLEDYLGLFQAGTSTDIEKLAARAYVLGKKTTMSYLKSQPGGRAALRSDNFGAQWGHGLGERATQQAEAKKISVLASTLANEVAVHRALVREKLGDSSELDLATELVEHYQDDAEVAGIVADDVELLRSFPFLNTKLAKHEVDHLLDRVNSGKLSYPEVTREGIKTVVLATAKKINLRGLLDSYGLAPEFIELQLPDMLAYLAAKQVVVVGLSADNEEQALLTIPPSGGDQGGPALLELRALGAAQSALEAEQSAERYLAFWQQNTPAAGLSHALIARDSQGEWQLSADEKIAEDSIAKHSLVSLADIYGKPYADVLNENYSEIPGGVLDNEMIRATGELLESNFSAELGVTYAQLQEDTNILAATGQFLIEMGWSWHKFSNIVYPQDSREAALFVDYYMWHLTAEPTRWTRQHIFTTTSATSKRLQVALNAEKTTLSEPKKIAAIENFLAKLPDLIAKGVITELIVSAHEDENLTRDERHVALFTEAVERGVAYYGKWGNLSIGFIDHEPRPRVGSVFDKINQLVELGVTDKQLKDNIFTGNVFNKLVAGKIVTERNLNEMRKLLDRQKLNAIVDGLDAVEDKEDVVHNIMSLPMLIQRYGVAKKFVNGTSSVSNLLSVLRGVEEKSMYKPIATRMLEEIKNGNSTATRIMKEIVAINSSEIDGKRRYFMGKKSPILYFTVHGTYTEVDNVVHALPLVKVGQIAYDAKYMEDGKGFLKDGKGLMVDDLDKLSEHSSIKQSLAAGHHLLVAFTLPGVTAHKFRALTHEIFNHQGVRPAQPSMLINIASDDDMGTFLEFTEDIVIDAGVPMIAVDKLGENIFEVAERVLGEALNRLETHGYVAVAAPPRASTSSAKNSTQVAQEQDSGFLRRELPVELKPATKQKTERSNKIREQVTEQALLPSAAQQASAELNAEITQLSNAIGRGEDLSAIPIWLHLQAIIRYMGTNPEALSKRADLLDKQGRFFAVVTAESTTLPRDEELQAVKLALIKFTNKRKDITPQSKQRLLKRLQSELASVEQKLRAEELTRARPNPTTPPATLEVKENRAVAITEEEPRVRLPQKDTLKKIDAEDVQAFLQGDLLPTYQSFSELMLHLDVNTVRELTTELNKTLIAVNARLVLQGEEEIVLLSTPFLTHLVGYEHGNSDFIDRTLWKLKIIATYYEHPQQAKVVGLIKDIMRAARIQRCENAEQLNRALENSRANLQVSAEQFATIKELTSIALSEWQKDWDM